MTSFTLGRAALIDWLTAIVRILGAIAVFRYKVNAVWLVVAGGIIGLTAHLGGLIN